MNIDIKKLRRLAEAPVLHESEWVDHDWAQEHFGSDCEAEFISTFTPSTILSLLDKIEQQEALIVELHTSIAGAVQHGEKGWQRYESANKMCINQQTEIAGLNQVIAELRKDAERLDKLELLGIAYGFQDMHEGNSWTVGGAYSTIRDALDDITKE
jgi:hypothetical protein